MGSVYWSPPRLDTRRTGACSPGRWPPRVGPFAPRPFLPPAAAAFPRSFVAYAPPMYTLPAAFPTWVAAIPPMYSPAPALPGPWAPALPGPWASAVPPSFPSFASPSWAPTYIIHPPGATLAPSPVPFPPAATLPPAPYPLATSMPSSVSFSASVSLPLTACGASACGGPPSFPLSALPASPASPTFLLGSPLPPALPATHAGGFLASSFPTIGLPPTFTLPTVSGGMRSPCGPGCRLLTPRAGAGGGDGPPATDVMASPAACAPVATGFGVPQFAQLPITSPGACRAPPVPLSFSPSASVVCPPCLSPEAAAQLRGAASAPSTPKLAQAQSAAAGRAAGSQSVPGVSMRRCLPGTPVAGASPKFALGRISVKTPEEAVALDGKDGVIDGLYYGTPIVIEGHGRYQPPPDRLGQRVPQPADQ